MFRTCLVGYHVYLYETVFWQGLHSVTYSRWVLSFLKVLCIDLIYLPKLSHICQQDSRFSHIIKIASCSFECILKIFHHLVSLSLNSLALYVSCFRVEGNLARHIDCIAKNSDWRVRSDGCGKICWGQSLKFIRFITRKCSLGNLTESF